MRKLFLILTMALLFSGNVFAQTWQTNPYVSSTNQKNIASGSTIASVSGNPGTGYKLGPGDTGYYILDYGGQTTGATLTSSAPGSGTRYVLPACSNAAIGYNFSITTAVSETITITPYATADSISYTISGSPLLAGQGIKNTSAAGASVSMQCSGNGIWNVQKISGTWQTST